MKTGPYTIIPTRVPGAAITRYVVKRGDKTVGAMFSFPSLDDCKRLEHPPKPRSVQMLSKVYNDTISKIRGRPRKDSRRGDIQTLEPDDDVA